ncbi:receptor-like protein 56 isoform X1 [Tasmannia lanceolata]|uniref:receptor-like protein 56 isoform X1 n=1 Tax=Tasmannia lanceolata TaxID=3420 RepID=UPI0040630FD7
MRGLHAFNIVGVLLFVSVCCCFYGGQACLEEERKALLQLKDSINDYPNNATYPVLEDWVGEDCCQWGDVSCSNSSSRVIGIDLFKARYPLIRIDLAGARYPYWFELWYPNATLFAQFKELESLDLGFNRIGGWVMPEGFIQMKNLKILRLGDNMLNQSSQSLSVMEDAKQSQICKLQVETNSFNDCSLVNSIWLDPFTCCLTIARWIGVQRGFLHSLNWFEFIVKRRSRSKEDIKKYQIGN